MTRLYILLFSLLFAVSPLSAQADLTRDRAFFEDQAQIYQDWLDRQGIGQHLRYREMRVEPDHLSVYLEFGAQELDLMINVWEQLKEAVEQHSAISLEQRLFYQLALVMEVPQDKLDLQLYNTYDPGQEPLFMRGIFFDETERRVKVVENNPKSQTATIRLPASMLPQKDSATSTTIYHTGTRDQVFERIAQFAQTSLERKTCEERAPDFELLPNEETLRFRVLDLCQVVLTDANRSIWGSLFGFNDIPREMLVFTIAYEPTLEGAKLEIEINGKYGAGFYNQVNRGAYHDMTTNPRFEETYLREYADRFAQQLKAHLSR